MRGGSIRQSGIRVGGWVFGEDGWGLAQRVALAISEYHYEFGEAPKGGGRGIKFLSLFNLDAALDEVNNCANAY